MKKKFGKHFQNDITTSTGVHRLRAFCKSINLFVDADSCALRECGFATTLFSKNEREMTIEELRRHRLEIAVFLGIKDFKCGNHTGLPLEIISIIGSMIQFESVEDDYATIQVNRSERGLEKADGNLYEQHQSIHVETDTEVVMEIFYLEEKDVLPHYLEREIEMSNLLYKHPNLWQIIDEIRTEDKIMIVRHKVMCTLSSIITRRGALDPGKIKYYMRQLFTFIHSCHSNGLICDGISSGSIYLDENSVLKITRNPANFYDPPERLMADSEERRIWAHSCKKDIWSLGCVFAKLVLGRWLFRFERGDNTDFDVLMKIFSTLGTPREEDWPQAAMLHDYYSELPQFPRRDLKDMIPQLDEDGIDLLGQMLCYNPNERISAREALVHTYLLPVPAHAESD